MRTALTALAALVSVSLPQTVSAAANVWTSNGPRGEAILSLAVDPSAPLTVYAGAELGHLFKSTDGGASWMRLETPFTSGVNAVVVDPHAPQRVYAGTGGVYISSDGGATWNATPLVETVVSALILDPTDPAILYAGSGGSGGVSGVFGSTDGAASWQHLSVNLSDSVVNALLIDRSAAPVLYAGLDTGAFRSTDGGVMWTDISAGLVAPVNALALDTRAPATLYAGTDGGAFASLDGGGAWNPINSGLTDDNGLASAVSSIVVDPVRLGVLYAGTFGDGVFVTADSGTSWHGLNDGLTNATVRTMAVEKGPPVMLYAGTFGDGVFVLQGSPCVGDCDGRNGVSPDEILTLVNIALGHADSTACGALEGPASVAQLLQAVNAALGCGGLPGTEN